jgi:predicted GNAT family N-acyltransferase
MPNNYRFQLLVPSHARTSNIFGDSQIDEQLYDHNLDSMQRLRGRVYLKDGAIQPWELDEDGRFAMRGDEQSWHLLLKSDDDTTIGCARYLVHPNTVALEQLKIFQSSIAGHREWGERVRLAVESDLRHAREHNLSYVEIGGLALSEEWRGTRAALDILTASYALAPMWGGCLASCTATVRHRSSSILRRIGGVSFEVDGEKLPAYEDPRYGCTMELLRFDSRSPAERYIPLINQLKATIACAPTLQRSAARRRWSDRMSDVGARKSLLLRMAAAYN